MTQRERSKLLFHEKHDEKGFSYIEVLITIMLLAIFFIPVMEMFSKSVSHLSYVGDMNTALSLAREGMELIRNLRLSKAQLAKRGDVYDPKLEEDPLELNGVKWRILQHIRQGTDPLAIDVLIFKDEILDEPVVKISTLIEDVE